MTDPAKSISPTTRGRSRYRRQRHVMTEGQLAKELTTISRGRPCGGPAVSAAQRQSSRCQPGSRSVLITTPRSRRRAPAPPPARPPRRAAAASHREHEDDRHKDRQQVARIEEVDPGEAGEQRQRQPRPRSPPPDRRGSPVGRRRAPEQQRRYAGDRDHDQDEAKVRRALRADQEQLRDLLEPRAERGVADVVGVAARCWSIASGIRASPASATPPSESHRARVAAARRAARSPPGRPESHAK